MSGIESWLERIKLQKYAQLFRDQEIDLDVLRELEDTDLEKIGIDALGDRKRILRAIRETVDGQLASDPAAADQSERRRVTLLLCDLVNFTGTLGTKDFEERHGALRKYYAWFEEVVAEFHGSIQRFEGDGVRAVFGFPGAEENAPELSVRAGLELVEAIRRFRPFGFDMDVRVTIATGPAVVGAEYATEATRESAVSGDIAHIVPRMKAIARPGSVLVSDETRRSAGDLFTYEDRGVHDLVHAEDPDAIGVRSHEVQVWEVTGEGSAKSRSAITYTTAHLTPLVSRDEEIDLLERRWERAASGVGQVVLLSGEAGIGKSRITRDFRRRLADQSHILLRFYCLPGYENTGLRPIVNEMLRGAEIVPTDAVGEKHEKLVSYMQRLAVTDTGVVALFADLLDLPVAPGSAPLNPSPEARRRKTLDTLERTLVESARTSPLLIIFEDLHWIDATSMELLNRVIRRLTDLPVLLLLTFRPGPDGFEPPWPNLHYMTSITVNRLSPTHSLEMIGHLLEEKDLLPPEKREIIEIAEGVPLFIEETCQAVIELESFTGATDSTSARVEPGASTPMPRPVNEALIARLDRLGEVKKVAQVAAAIGRGFTFDLLAEVAGLDEAQLRRYLEQLRAAQIIYERSSSPSPRYEFKHGLLRDAAYESMLRSARKRLHARIAAVLEERYPDVVEVEPERLAHHLTEAGIAEQAITYWQKAGERAIARHASIEAIAHLSTGLQLVPSVVDEEQRRELELHLRLLMGSPLLMVEGHNAAAVEMTFSRVRELCELVGPSKELFSAIVGLWRYYLSDLKLEQALEQAELGGEIGRRLGDDALAHEAGLMSGACLLYMGCPLGARDHFARANASLPEIGQPSFVLTRASEPGVMGLSWAAWTEWQLGYPAQALALNDEAIERATMLRHPYSLEFAHFFAAVLHQGLLDYGRAEDHAQKVIDLAEDETSDRWLAGSRAVKGWALAHRGNHAEGLRLVQEGIAHWTGRLGLPRLQVMLAEVEMQMLEYEQALRVLQEAAAVIDQTKSFMYSAEVCRVTGIVCWKLAQEGFEEERFRRRAEQQLAKALEVARSQSAGSLALRAALDLSRYLQAAGEHHRALLFLEEAVAGASQDHETEDLRAAREQLELLRRPSAAVSGRSRDNL